MKSVEVPTGDRLQLAYLRGGVVQFRADRLGPRTLPDYELVFLIQGTATYIADGARYPAPPGSILFTRPGFHEAYVWDPVSPTRHAYFHFLPECLPASWRDLSLWPSSDPTPTPSSPHSSAKR